MTKVTSIESAVLIKSLEDIWESDEFLGNYGIKATIVLSNLIGRLKDDLSDSINDTKVNNIRGFERCFVSKANIWQTDYESGDLDGSFYNLVYESVVNTFIETEFQTYVDEAVPSQIIVTLIYMFSEYYNVELAKQLMSLKLSSMSSKEYNETDAYDLLVQFIALCLDNQN